MIKFRAGLPAETPVWQIGEGFGFANEFQKADDIDAGGGLRADSCGRCRQKYRFRYGMS